MWDVSAFEVIDGRQFQIQCPSPSWNGTGYNRSHQCRSMAGFYRNQLWVGRVAVEMIGCSCGTPLLSKPFEPGRMEDDDAIEQPGRRNSRERPIGRSGEHCQPGSRHSVVETVDGIAVVVVD